MEFFKFDTIKKYTKSLLDTFNDIQVEKYINETDTKLVTIPISFGSKDAASVFSEKETEQLLQGNFNILPRMSLSLVDMERDEQRATSRFQIPIRIEGPDGKITQYQHNCVPYVFTFTLNVVTKTLTDLTTIIEQILPFFNPNINLKVRELDWLSEPTTVNVELMSVTYDLPSEYDGLDIRICTADIMMRVHGNIYPPIKNSTLIKNIKYYLSAVADFGQINEDIVHKYKVDEDTFRVLPEFFERLDYDSKWNKDAPVLTEILGNTKLIQDKESIFRIIYNKPNILIYITVINVVEDSGTSPIISKHLNYFKVLPRKKGTLKLSVQAINSYEIQSNIIEIELEVE